MEAQALAGHEVRKRLLARLRRERIALAAKEKVFLLPEKNQPNVLSQRPAAGCATRAVTHRNSRKDSLTIGNWAG